MSRQSILVLLAVSMAAAAPVVAAGPDWVRDAVIYQVLVDRFANGDPSNDRAGEDEPRPPSQNPDYRPDVNYLGGDLRGLREKLDYLADLGVTCLWLTPVLKGPFYHGYHVMDYEQIDPHFGDEAELKSLVEEAHGKGMRVLMDYVANHASEYHPSFQSALKRRDSPFHDWFLWKSWPREYERFYYFPDLPKWNTANPQVADHLIGAAEAWTDKLGLDGFRLDYAVGPGREFWRKFRQRVGQDRFLIGEVWEDAQQIASWSDVLDGCMDFPRRAVYTQFFAQNSIDVDSFDRSMHDLRRIYGPLAMGSFLGNHDMPRFLHAAGGDVWKLYVAVLAQMTFDEVPIVYYGDEVMGPDHVEPGSAGGGASHLNDEGSDQATRKMMPWGAEQDGELHGLFRTFIRLRRELAPLRRGGITTVLKHNALGLYGFERRLDDEAVLVALNNGASSAVAELPAGEGEWRDLLGNRKLASHEGRLAVPLPGHWGAILVREDERARELAAASRIPADVRRALGFQSLHRE